MADPSTTSYYPFDSDTLSVFKATQTKNHLNLAFLTLLLYDHAITLDKEVEWIWTLKWRLPKILFLVNRYFIASLFLIYGIPQLIFPVPISFCRFERYLGSFLPLLNFGAVELLLIIRVCSLYEHRKGFMWSLGGFYVLSLGGVLASQILDMLPTSSFLYYRFLPGCWLWYTGTLYPWITWAAFIVIEGFIMLLTAYKSFPYRNSSNRTIIVLARDSIAYFIIVFSCLVSVIICDTVTPDGVSVRIASQYITSIAVGRMMMNIRGLIFDDPEHTVYLQTLHFATDADEDTEMDEFTGGDV